MTTEEERQVHGCAVFVSETFSKNEGSTARSSHGGERVLANTKWNVKLSHPSASDSRDDQIFEFDRA